MIQINEQAKIENPRNYEACAIEQLDHLLKIGSPAHPDPRRKNFYDVAGATENFYVHVSPISGNVVLLAKWLRQSQDCYANTGQLVA